jgi:hypothetical protein
VCFKRPSTPQVVRTDPAAQQRQAEAIGNERANREAIDRNARRRRTALMTQGNVQGTSGTALQQYGQQTLGNAL